MIGSKGFLIFCSIKSWKTVICSLLRGTPQMEKHSINLKVYILKFYPDFPL